MKTLLSVLVFSAATAVGIAQTSPSAISSPVAGFLPMEIPGASADGTVKTSLKSLGLVHPVQYKGTSEAARSTVLYDRDSAWTENQFNAPDVTASPTHYIELTTGSYAGATFDILQTEPTRKRLKLAQPLPRGVSGKSGYVIRQHWTIAGVFGADNTAGFAAGTAESADKISIYSGTKSEDFFFSTGEQGNGWRRVGGGTTDASGRTIYPDDALVFRRISEGDIRLIIKGIVKAGQSIVPVQKGINTIGNVHPVPITLASSNLFTGKSTTGVRSGSETSADQVRLFDGTGYTSYYYQRSGKFGFGWRRQGDPIVDAGATAIPAGSAFVISRRGKGFNWKAPEIPSAQ